MATTTLSDKKIAIMVANGFDEARFIEIQKMLLAINARLKVIAPGAGLAHGRVHAGSEQCLTGWAVVAPAP